MAPSPEDLAFARFRRTGAPDALAEVFDRTAGQLLLVAWHVTRRGAEAEDLVQATFLQAMQSAERFDAERRVLPWLLGILGNLAGSARRHAVHAARVAAAPDVDQGTPLTALLTAEVREGVARALAALPEAYRQVLDLRFVHGLRSVQIARSLGRSPETVRTQVRRGLEHLRRLLPKGLAVPVAVLAVHGGGLAAVRSAVLAQARVATVAPVTVFSGAWLLVVLVALWAAGSSLWVPQADPVPAAVVAVIGPVQGASRPVQTASRVGVVEPERLALAPRAAAAPVGAPSAPGRIRGRCVADESGVPIAGARVWLTHLGESAPPECQSAGDGRFALEFEPWAKNGCATILSAEAPGRARLEGMVAEWPAGRELDLGDVRLVRGIAVHGQVRDQGGAPVPGVVAIGRAAHRGLLPLGDLPGASPARSAPTDAQGRFAWDGALEPGTFVVGVPGRTVVGAKTVTLQWQERERDLHVVVATQDPAKAIRGRCVDAQGQPFTGCEVILCSPNSHPHDPHARFYRTSSDQHGAFLLPHEDSFPERPTVRYESALAQPGSGERDVAWGTQDLRLVLPRKPAAPAEPGAEVAIEVVDADGAPVEDFALRCLADPRQSCRFLTHLGALRLGGNHPGGRVVVTASTRWRNVLFVEPEDPRFMPVGPVFFAGDQGRVRAVVRRSAEFRVRVQDRAGAPVANTTVELVRPWAPEAVTLLTKTVPLRDPFGVLQLVWAVRVGEVITDADGVATFTAGAGETGLVLRSWGPRTRPFVVAEVTAGSDVVPVTAELGGILSGRLLGWDAVHRRLGRVAVALCRRGAARLDSGPQFLLPRWAPREDGSYRIEGAETGAWDVHLLQLVGEPRPAAFGEEIQFSTRLDPPLASVVLEDGKPQSLDLDLRPFAPGRIDGQLLLDGKALAHTRWTIDPDGTARRSLPGGTTDRDGRFTLDAALAGTHWLVIQWSEPASGKPLRLAAREPIAVDVGQTVQATVELHSEDAEDTMQVIQRMLRRR